MKSTIKALFIHDFDIRDGIIPNTLEALQEQVGGYIETVQLVRGHAVMIVNEEGRLLHLTANPLASAIAGVGIVGPALIVGVDGENFTDVPEDIKRRIKVRFG